MVVIKSILLMLLISIAVVQDTKTYRIANRTVLWGIIAGIVLNGLLTILQNESACVPKASLTVFLSTFPSAFLSACLSASLPAVLLLPLFALRMLGAGDIKLLCAAGAFAGFPGILFVLAYTFLAGGLMAGILILVRGNARGRFLHLSTYLKTILLTRSFSPYTNFNDKSDGAKFHFSYAIAAGALVFILQPLLLPLLR